MIGYDTFVTVMFTLLVYLIGIRYIWLPNGFRSKQRCPLNYHKMEGSSDSQYLSPSYFVEIVERNEINLTLPLPYLTLCLLTRELTVYEKHQGECHS